VMRGRSFCGTAYTSVMGYRSCSAGMSPFFTLFVVSPRWLSVCASPTWGPVGLGAIPELPFVPGGTHTIQLVDELDSATLWRRTNPDFSPSAGPQVASHCRNSANPPWEL